MQSQFLQHYRLENDNFFPPNLRQRFHSWDNDVPTSQFQQYGPMNALFSLIFTPDRYLVKPQALLRKPYDLPENIPYEHVLSYLRDDPGVDDIPLDQWARMEGKHIKDKTSIDSQDEVIQIGGERGRKAYPDFTITAYSDDSIQSASSSNQTHPKDIIVLVVELGSAGKGKDEGELRKYRQAIANQLNRYMNNVRHRRQTDGRVVYGLAMVGTHFFFTHSHIPKLRALSESGYVWRSIYEGHFVPELKRLSATNTMDIMIA